MRARFVGIVVVATLGCGLDKANPFYGPTDGASSSSTGSSTSTSTSGTATTGSTSTATTLGTTDPGNTNSGSAGATGTSGPPQGDWWNDEWLRRARLTFDNAARGALIDVPILVELEASRFGQELILAGGDDIRFVDPDGTVLSYEIEAWEPQGTSSLWVRVPQIDGRSASDHIWVYFDNADAPPADDAAATWPPEYSAVWHLTGLGDSTSQDNDAANAGTDPTDAFIASGRLALAGENDHITVAVGSFQWGPQFTVSGWGRPEAVNGPRGLLTHPLAGGGENSVYLGFQGGAAYGRVETNTTDPIVNLSDATAQSWVWLALTYDGSTMTLYVDGAEVGSDGPGGNVAANSAQLLLGADRDNGMTGADSSFFDGALDEIRIENVSRSADWMDAQYASMTRTLIEYGPVEVSD